MDSAYNGAIGNNNTMDGSNQNVFVVGKANDIGEENETVFVFGELNSTGNEDDVLAAIGYANTVSYTNNIALGMHNTVYGYANQAIGYNNYVVNSAWLTQTIGRGLINDQDYQIVIGAYNDTTTVSGEPARVLVVGNGNGVASDPEERSNALIVYETGDVSVKKAIYASTFIADEHSGDIQMGPFTAE